MALIDDGDLIRGLGFVALYAAYLEEAVDECLSVVAARDPESDHKLFRRPTSQKIEYIKQQLKMRAPLSEELTKFPTILQAIGGRRTHGSSRSTPRWPWPLATAAHAAKRSSRCGEL